VNSAFYLFDEPLVVAYETLDRFSGHAAGSRPRAFESITFNFVVKRKHFLSSIRMFHLDVAAFAMDLLEAKPLARRQDFSTGEERQLHSKSSTTSRDSS